MREQECCRNQCSNSRREHITLNLHEHTCASLFRRLEAAGFPRAFVRRVILPDWWDDSCEHSSDFLPDFETRVARFLKQPLEAIRDASAPLAIATFPNANLFRLHYPDLAGRMDAVFHTAFQVGGSVVRCRRYQGLPQAKVPYSSLEWHKELTSAGTPVSLSAMLEDLWGRGVAVIPVDEFPEPRFQSMVCFVENRPAILIGRQYDDTGRVAFVIAHIIGHILGKHFTPERPVLIEDGQVQDNSVMEMDAVKFAIEVMLGENAEVNIDDFATRLLTTSVGVFNAHSKSLDYSRAPLAVKALQKGQGARRLMLRYLEANLSMSVASERDRELLRCTYGADERPLGKARV